MGMKKNVTFKDNERERRLYAIVESHHSVSGFIKDAIEFYDSYLKGQQKPEKKTMQAVRF